VNLKDDGREQANPTNRHEPGSHEQRGRQPRFKPEIDVLTPFTAQLAADVEGPWRQEWAESGGEAETRSLERWTNVAVIAVTVVVLLALAGLGLVIWLIVT